MPLAKLISTIAAASWQQAAVRGGLEHREVRYGQPARQCAGHGHPERPQVEDRDRPDAGDHGDQRARHGRGDAAEKQQPGQQGEAEQRGRRMAQADSCSTNSCSCGTNSLAALG